MTLPLLAVESASGGATASGLLVLAVLGAVAFLVGRMASGFLSEVVAFIAVGIVVGPEVLGVIGVEDLIAFDPVVSVALGAMVFVIGERLQLAHLLPQRHTLFPVAVLGNVATFVVTFVALLLAGLDTRVAYLLAAIAPSTAPATVVALISEKRARGAFTDHLLSSAALNNLTSALLFGFGAPFVFAQAGEGGSLGESAVTFAELVVSPVAIGGLAGWIIRRTHAFIRTPGERLLYIFIFLIGVVGTARLVGTSVVIVTLIMGAIVANDRSDTEPLFAAVRTLDAPIILVFFVVTGAEVDLGELTSLGGAGVVYVLARASGRIGGAWLGLELTRSGRRRGWGHRIGTAQLPYAGMAVGLAAFTVEKAEAMGEPGLGQDVSTLILGAVVVFELVGPVLVGRALERVGEAGRATSEETEAAQRAVRDPHRIRHVLFPVSSSEMARQKADTVVDLALSAGAALTVLHVVAPGDEPEPDVADPALSIVRQVAAARGVTVELLTRSHDSVVDCVVEEARTAAVDLIVLGEAPRRLLNLGTGGMVHEIVERVGAGVRVVVVPTVFDWRSRTDSAEHAEGSSGEPSDRLSDAPSDGPSGPSEPSEGDASASP